MWIRAPANCLTITLVSSYLNEMSHGVFLREGAKLWPRNTATPPTCTTWFWEISQATITEQFLFLSWPIVDIRRLRAVWNCTDELILFYSACSKAPPPSWSRNTQNRSTIFPTHRRSEWRRGLNPTMHWNKQDVQLLVPAPRVYPYKQRVDEMGENAHKKERKRKKKVGGPLALGCSRFIWQIRII